MRIEVRQGELADKPKFQHLMQLYHVLTEIRNLDGTPTDEVMISRPS